jgi:hypothetical protein
VTIAEDDSHVRLRHECNRAGAPRDGRGTTEMYAGDRIDAPS